MRELGNVLERAAPLARGEVIPADAIELSEPRRAPPTAVAEVATWEEAGGGASPPRSAPRAGGSTGDGGAAELLGLKPTTLQTKMRRLGVERGDFVR